MSPSRGMGFLPSIAEETPSPSPSEEMAGLCAPWGPPSFRKEENYRTCIRTRFVSSTTDLRSNQEENTNHSLYNCSEVSSNELEAAVAAKLRRKRSPSLPPIYNRGNCQDQGTQPYDQEEDGEGETSGYASDSNEKNTDYWNQQRQLVYNQQQDSWMSEPGYDRVSRRFVNKQGSWYNNRGGYRTPDSVLSTPPCRLWSCGGSDEVNRMRWGDRGVGVGHLWEPSFQEPEARLPQVQGSGRGTPSWLERGLNKLTNCDASMASSTTQVLVINHDTPEPGNLSRELAGSCDTISTQSHGESNRTFIRGQNAPLEPEVLMERERKRQKALEHQNAIRQQLEERERKRKEEKERRIREEKAEEERIKREQEVERKRMEDEQRRQREREEKEARKAAAMREALENAEKKAREEKIRARSKHLSDSSSKLCDFTAEMNEHERVCDNNTVVNDSQHSIRQCNDTQLVNPGPQSEEKVLRNSDATQTPVKSLNETLLIATETMAMPADGLAVVLGNTSDASSHEVLPTTGGSVQLALLMSPGIQPPPLLVENRLLTPSKYRTCARERGTQTDSELIMGSRGRRLKEKTVGHSTRNNRKKSASLERPHQGCKLPLRCRSQSQPTQPRMRLEDRPKWGVNRPGTQYIKQSEKDPYYQRRLRQRLMRAALAGMGGDTGTESDTGSQRRRKINRGSSDDNSRSPSPSHKIYSQVNKKNSKSNSSQSRIISVEERMNVTLTKRVNEHEQSENRRNSERKEVMSSPAITQHLENNERIKHEELNNRRSGTGVLHSSQRGTKRLLKRQSEPPVTIENTNEQWSTAQDILSQLSSLRQGLLLKQQEWDSTRSHTPHSESSW